MKPVYRNIFNILLNQSIWFICIIGGDWLSVICGFLYLLVYMSLIGEIQQEWRSILLIAITGFSVDILLSALGIIHFDSDFPLPVWLFVLWLSFASLFHHGLQWLQSRYIVSILSGSIFAPLSYIAGTQMSENQIQVPIMVFAGIYAVVWAMFMPLFLTIAKNVK